MPWYYYTSIVVLAATGIHFFSKLAKDTLDPVVALVVTMASALTFSIILWLFSQNTGEKAIVINKGTLMYIMVGLCITVAHAGIFYMFKAGAPISLATPIARFIPAILAVFLGVLFFGESLKPAQILGLVMAAAAVILVVR